MTINGEILVEQTNTHRQSGSCRRMQKGAGTKLRVPDSFAKALYTKIKVRIVKELKQIPLSRSVGQQRREYLLIQS